MTDNLTYQPGDKIGGLYEVHQSFTGGMGEVYLCLDLKTHEPYALKTFSRHTSLNQNSRKTFEQEIATWIALGKHPNIVRCFSMNVFAHQPFMLLEWISSHESRGVDLRSWLQFGALDLRSALEVTLDIARGLLHAQQKQPGIVHCDIKPENILIDEGRVAKITDFGLARIFQQTLMQAPQLTRFPGHFQTIRKTGHIVGTPAYMAPEQWRGESLDVRTDIYALGCVLYEMLTGHWVFGGSTLTGFRRNHLEAEIPRLSDEEQTFPPLLDEVFARCLAKDRHDRFATVDELLQHMMELYFQQFCDLPGTRASENGLSAIDLNNRGSTYARLHHDEEALRDFDRAISYDPNYAIAYFNRGRVYAQLHRHEDALEDFTHALALDPTDQVTYLHRGRTYADIGAHHAALADYTQAIRLEPTDATFYYWRAKAYLALGRCNRALSDLSIATMLNPEYAAAYYEMGMMLSQQEKWHEALPYCEKAVKLGSVKAIQQTARIQEELIHQHMAQPCLLA
jgi:serine/threonine protein kinase